MSVREDVKLAVERAAGAPAEHAESVPIVETFKGEIVWQGVVEVFRVSRKPNGTAYGWAVDSPSGPQFVAIVGDLQVDSPIKAVRAWIISQIKRVPDWAD